MKCLYNLFYSVLHKSQESMSRLIKQNLNLHFFPHEGKLLSSTHL